jgi:hypothetical protein
MVKLEFVIPTILYSSFTGNKQQQTDCRNGKLYELFSGKRIMILGITTRETEVFRTRKTEFLTGCAMPFFLFNKRFLLQHFFVLVKQLQ